MSEPKRTGLMQLLSESQGVQFVVPVYQRNYTWTKDKNVKQYMYDLHKVLNKDYKNHFIGIIIYLEKTLDFSTREFSIIDGQQRMTTTFLILYAMKHILEERNENEIVSQLNNQFLTNPNHKDNIKYKLKPLVSDDEVYKCIVESKFDDIKNKNSNVYKNYFYIKDELVKYMESGFTANDILMAMNKLYLVCVPIDDREENPQKIFESINATGEELTSADLIRNYLLMDLTSDKQEDYYKNYWRKLENNVNQDSKKLESFFRTYLAIKKYELVSKKDVYREFVKYVESINIDIKDLFEDLIKYSKIYYNILNKNINDFDSKVRYVFEDFRKLKSEMPLSLVMELYSLYLSSHITLDTLSEAIWIIISYMVRRSICDIDSQNISRLFPTVLRDLLKNCNNNYENIINELNQILIGANVNTSGSYMPTDKQMHDILMYANVYERDVLRMILDRLELFDNQAPVDLSALSIEHLMPQTPTELWYDELDTDEKTYFENLHRLGNLTLATKVDNSIMQNSIWDYKNEVLKNTLHIKMNNEIYGIKKWTLGEIDKRTDEMIKKICELYPYPNDIDLSITSANDDEKEAKESCIDRLSKAYNIESISDSKFYKTKDGAIGFRIYYSKQYNLKDNKEKYWYGYRLRGFETIENCKEQKLVFICNNNNNDAFCIPRSFIEKIKDSLTTSSDENGNIRHWHINIIIHDKKNTILLSKPQVDEIDISKYKI